MKKRNEQTLGSYLAAAQSLSEIMKGFSNFKAPAANISLEHLNQLITGIKASNTATAAARSNLSMATEQRRLLFRTERNSIQSIMRPIRLAVKAQYGTGSKHAADVSTHLKGMRAGGSKRKSKNIAADVDKSATKTVSTSHLSMGSITKSFSDMVTAIAQFTPVFDPGNQAISMQSLLAKHQQLLTAMDKVTGNQADWKIARVTRNGQYTQLKECVTRLKNAIESQYGSDSEQYLSIKSLAI